MIYGPALAVGLAALIDPASVNGREALTAGLIAVHFLKRCLEVLFVHQYSGSVSAAVSGGIGIFYGLISLIVVGMQGTVDPAIYQAGVSNTLLAAGLALFSIGQAGNLYHHILLARLRGAKAEGDTSSIDPATRKRSYQLPTGGLFDLVTMPHYLFEIIAWVGLSLCTQQLNVILVAAGMSSYLSGRAAATTEWYRQKFPKAVPLGRKHLVPYIF